MPDVSELQDWIGPVGVGLAVFVITVVLSILLHRVVTRSIGAEDGRPNTGRQVGRLASVVLFVLGTVYALQLAGVRVGPLLGAMGVGGIAVAIAAQDLLQNFLAGLTIQARRPFKVGDQIRSGDYEGTVLDIDLRATRLRTYDGLDVVLPNADVLSHPIVNHTRTPLRRSTLAVGVAYDTDLERAQQVIISSLTEHGVLEGRPAPSAWVEEFADSSIVFAAMFWHPSDMASTWKARSEAAIAIKRGLDRAGITIAFPQRVIWNGDDPA